MEGTKWDVIGLSEVKRNGEECIKLKDGHVLYYKGEKGGPSTGFIINNKWADRIQGFKGYSNRVSRVIFSIKKEKDERIKIIQVYAPTSQSSDEEIEHFYRDVQIALENNKCRTTVVMGDWNAKIGENGRERAVGKYGIGERNDRGDRLVAFAEVNNLYIMNSFYNKPDKRRWTWVSPNGEVYNEIDFIISNKKKIFTDVEVLKDVTVRSDHRPVRAKIIIRKESKWKISKNIKDKTRAIFSDRRRKPNTMSV